MLSAVVLSRSWTRSASSHAAADRNQLSPHDRYILSFEPSALRPGAFFVPRRVQVGVAFGTLRHSPTSDSTCNELCRDGNLLCMATKTAPNMALKRARFDAQMSRASLAGATKLAPNTLRNIEVGRARPRMDTAARIAQALNKEVGDLFPEVIG